MIFEREGSVGAEIARGINSFVNQVVVYCVDTTSATRHWNTASSLPWNLGVVLEMYKTLFILISTNLGFLVRRDRSMVIQRMIAQRIKLQIYIILDF